MEQEKIGQKQLPFHMGQLADEVAKLVIARMPKFPARNRKKSPQKTKKELINSIFLDTSAIIDGRIFTIIRLGLFMSSFVVLESVLLELKHIADSQDTVKRERGRNGLEFLEKIKKTKEVKLVVLATDTQQDKKQEVDEQLISMTKKYKGRLITCDYNLEKKATIHGIRAINMHALAQCLKISAVPGEALHIKVSHEGKEESQGVGYLDDGTMIVIEEAKNQIGTILDVVISRVIQTSSGKIFFAKKI